MVVFVATAQTSIDVGIVVVVVVRALSCGHTHARRDKRFKWVSIANTNTLTHTHKRTHAHTHMQLKHVRYATVCSIYRTLCYTAIFCAEQVRRTHTSCVCIGMGVFRLDGFFVGVTASPLRDPKPQQKVGVRGCCGGCVWLTLSCGFRA